MCLTSYVISNYVPAPWETNTFTSAQTQLPSKMLNLPPLRWRWQQRWQRKYMFSKTPHAAQKNEDIRRKNWIVWISKRKWNDHEFNCSKLTFWKSNQSNSINGSDGSAFHPLLTKDERIYIFTPDLCRYELAVPVFTPSIWGYGVKLLVTVVGTHRSL